MNQNNPASTQTIIEKLRERNSYLTTKDVMNITRKTRQTICGWVKSGAMTAVRIGKDNMFDPAVIADWLEARVL